MILPIQGYSNQSFTAKKFRLPIEGITLSLNGTPVYSDSFKGYREYSNPNAEQFYKKAQKASNITEKLLWLAKMGDYKIVDINVENKIGKFLNQVL